MSVPSQQTLPDQMGLLIAIFVKFQEANIKSLEKQQKAFLEQSSEEGRQKNPFPVFISTIRNQMQQMTLIQESFKKYSITEKKLLNQPALLQSQQVQNSRKIYLVASVAFFLGVLCTYTYYNLDF